MRVRGKEGVRGGGIPILPSEESSIHSWASVYFFSCPIEVNQSAYRYMKNVAVRKLVAIGLKTTLVCALASFFIPAI